MTLLRRVRRAGGLRRQEIIWAYILILPNLVGFLIFAFGPLVASLGLMFTEWSIVKPPSLVGLDNVRKLLSDDVFATALRNTFYYVGLYVPAITVLAFLLANLLDRKVKGIAIFRTIYFVPSVCLLVSIAVLWQWLYDTNSGWFNYILSLVGVGPVGWLSDKRWAMPSITAMNVWRRVGYYSVIFLAALQGVPQELYEAAEIDGAGAWAKVRRITVPLVFPTTFFVLVTAFIEAFQLFTEAHVMTGGGPGYATTTLVILIYRNAFTAFKMGYASLQAWVLFACIFAITIIQWRLAKERGYGFQD